VPCGPKRNLQARLRPPPLRLRRHPLRLPRHHRRRPRPRLHLTVVSWLPMAESAAQDASAVTAARLRVCAAVASPTAAPGISMTTLPRSFSRRSLAHSGRSSVCPRRHRRPCCHRPRPHPHHRLSYIHATYAPRPSRGYVRQTTGRAVMDFLATEKQSSQTRLLCATAHWRARRLRQRTGSLAVDAARVATHSAGPHAYFAALNMPKLLSRPPIETRKPSCAPWHP
jgi:hypothetical protein